MVEVAFPGAGPDHARRDPVGEEDGGSRQIGQQRPAARDEGRPALAPRRLHQPVEGDGIVQKAGEADRDIVAGQALAMPDADFHQAVVGHGQAADMVQRDPGRVLHTARGRGEDRRLWRPSAKKW